MAQQAYDAIVVGGGHNGLVTAFYLARDGLSVLVLERLERIGGAVATEELYPRFKVPFCAYIVHMLHGKIIDDLDLRSYGFDLYQPVYVGSFHPFPDGTAIVGGSTPEMIVQELAKFSEHDAQSYLGWSTFWERACRIIYRYFLTDPPSFAQVTEDVRGTADEEVWETMLTVSMRDLVDQHFEHPHVKAHFINAQDHGDPSAPGSIMSVAYIRSGMLGKAENRGIPKGGMGQVSLAMMKAAQAQGVEVRLGTPVKQVIVENGRAKGVQLANGEEIRAFIVVSNADPKRTYTQLVDPTALDEAFKRKVRNLKTRANCVKALVALKEFPDFSRYLGPGFDPRYAVSTTICPSVEWFQASWDACKNGQVSRTPIMHIQFPSVYDRSLAPPGRHVMSSWTLYYPAQLKEGSWDEGKTKQEIEESLMDMLSEYAPNFRRCVLDFTVQTPLDIEARIGMTDGNIRHIDVTPEQMFSRRMPYRAPIEGLYLCGAGTHPGGELTGAPGYNCARTILKDLAQPAPSYDELAQVRDGG
jgi:phytoene dehydrogenase-like protein